jgi:hypothetical protein
MERALRAIRAEAGETHPLDIVFVPIGYRDLTDGKPAHTPNSRSALPCAILSRSALLTGSRSRKALPSAIDW